jgi:DNA-binding transcriptional LysR family regulator
VFALFLTAGLDEIDWTPVDSLTAQKRLVQAGLGIALLSQSHAAEELNASAISTIHVDDLAASHDIVVVTRNGGFLSAASRRLLDIIRADYASAKSAGLGKISQPARKRRPRRGGKRRAKAR